MRLAYDISRVRFNELYCVSSNVAICQLSKANTGKKDEKIRKV